MLYTFGFAPLRSRSSTAARLLVALALAVSASKCACILSSIVAERVGRAETKSHFSGTGVRVLV